LAVVVVAVGHQVADVAPALAVVVQQEALRLNGSLV
jgi:hypothetical protein